MCLEPFSIIILITVIIEYRIEEACKLPSEFVSIVTDGMAQTHCNLPWLGNLAQFSQCLKQHLQGVLCHGRVLTIYRTFHNITNTANLQLHTLLLKLEDISNVEGGLPDTVYLQIDGGPENTARVVIAMCELIIHKKLTKKIVLTRLPVGHTHCDIDGVFGRLWLYIRDRHCNTPQDYTTFIKAALSKSGCYEANVRDILLYRITLPYLTVVSINILEVIQNKKILNTSSYLRRLSQTNFSRLE